MENARYFLNQHPPIFRLVEKKSRLDVGVSDRPWIYLRVNRDGDLSSLLARIPAAYHHYAVIEDWMVPLIDPHGNRYRELICMRYELPRDQTLPPVRSHVTPLDVADAEVIQSSHAYGDFTDTDYVISRIKRGHHAGVRVDGELVAWAITHDDGAIGFLYVKPEHRGAGYASDLTAFIIQELRTEDLAAYVHVEEGNQASTALVEKFGFVPDRRVRWFSLPPSIETIDRLLEETFGHQNWWPADTPFEMMVGAILTQNTAWTNVEKALANLAPLIDAQQILDLPLDDLEQRIRPSGLYRQKAQRLKRLATWFQEHPGGLEALKRTAPDKLRSELLSLKGVGPETADSILLYALGMPYFVVDTYTRRFLSRLGYKLPKGYEGLRRKVEGQFDTEGRDRVDAYGDFHARIIRHGKAYCRAKPQCADCPLTRSCRYAEENAGPHAL